MIEAIQDRRVDRGGVPEGICNVQARARLASAAERGGVTKGTALTALPTGLCALVATLAARTRTRTRTRRRTLTTTLTITITSRS